VVAHRPRRVLRLSSAGVTLAPYAPPGPPAMGGFTPGDLTPYPDRTVDQIVARHGRLGGGGSSIPAERPRLLGPRRTHSEGNLTE
jgi:hypothetical protein